MQNQEQMANNHSYSFLKLCWICMQYMRRLQISRNISFHISGYKDLNSLCWPGETSIKNLFCKRKMWQNIFYICWLGGFVVASFWGAFLCIATLSIPLPVNPIQIPSSLFALMVPWRTPFWKRFKSNSTHIPTYDSKDSQFFLFTFCHSVIDFFLHDWAYFCVRFYSWFEIYYFNVVLTSSFKDLRLFPFRSCSCMTADSCLGVLPI